MGTLLPLGHISAALASVYVISQFLVLDYSLESWNDQEKAGRQPYDWPQRLRGDDESEDLTPLLFPNKARVLNVHRSDGSTLERGRVKLTLSSIKSGNSFDHFIDLYPPYITCLERWSYARYEDIAIHFPYDCLQVDRLTSWLRQILSSGLLSATLVQGNGILKAVPSTYWLSEQCEDVLRYDVATMVAFEDGFAFGRVSLNLEDIDGVFRGAWNKSPSTAPTALADNREQDALDIDTAPGRPTKFDIEAFMAEATKILLAGKAASQAELMRQAVDAYAAADHRGGKPGPEWAKKKIATLCRQAGVKFGY